MMRTTIVLLINKTIKNSVSEDLPTICGFMEGGNTRPRVTSVADGTFVLLLSLSTNIASTISKSSTY